MRKYFHYLVVIFVTVVITQTINYFVSINSNRPNNVYLATQKQPYSNISRSSFPQTSVVHKQFNFHLVSPGVWRSSQPNEESIIRMKSHGLKTIINLRCKESIHLWEKQLATKLAINYYHFPMDARVKQDKKKLTEVLRIINELSNQPVLIHCHAGKDRTGLISALYKLKFTNARFDDVHKEMLMYGYSEEAFPEIIKTVTSWEDISN